MKVLVACEESQAVCKAFRELGHEAYSCDIQECSGGHPEWHIKGDALAVLNPSKFTENELAGIEFFTMDNELHYFVGGWDMIIAHPPCTYLTNAGARWLWAGGELNQERYKKGMEAKEFFMQFLQADCPRIAVENPAPSAVYELPAYTQIIQPYEYGHAATKKTCLWLKGLPLLAPTEIVEPVKGRYFQQKNGNWRYSCWEMDQRGGKDRAREKQNLPRYRQGHGRTVGWFLQRKEGFRMSKHPRTDQYLADRENGLSYRQISEKYGVSYQSVHSAVCLVDGSYKTVISERGCIYPNLRAWLNQDRRRRDRFFECMKGCTIREYLKGIRQPKKDIIDKMLAITGMTYEEMFREVSDGN